MPLSVHGSLNGYHPAAGVERHRGTEVDATPMPVHNDQLFIFTAGGAAATAAVARVAGAPVADASCGAVVAAAAAAAARGFAGARSLHATGITCTTGTAGNTGSAGSAGSADKANVANILQTDHTLWLLSLFLFPSRFVITLIPTATSTAAAI